MDFENPDMPSYNNRMYLSLLTKNYVSPVLETASSRFDKEGKKLINDVSDMMKNSRTIFITADMAYRRGYFSRALQYYSLVEKTVSGEQFTDGDQLVNTVGNIAHCHRHLNHYDDALECYNKALELNEWTTNIKRRIHFLRCLSLVYIGQLRYKLAQQTIDEALNLCSTHLPKYHAEVAELLFVRGEVYREKCEFTEALVFYYQAREMQLSQKNLPVHRAILARLHSSIGLTLSALEGCHARALEESENALRLLQSVYPDGAHEALIRKYEQNLQDAKEKFARIEGISLSSVVSTSFPSSYPPAILTMKDIEGRQVYSYEPYSDEKCKLCVLIYS